MAKHELIPVLRKELIQLIDQYLDRLETRLAAKQRPAKPRREARNRTASPHTVIPQIIQPPPDPSNPQPDGDDPELQNFLAFMAKQ